MPVAPRVGAWIETSYAKNLRHSVESPPAWGRGLKHEFNMLQRAFSGSPPAWGRGLKHPWGVFVTAYARSPPAWGRGLKRCTEFWGQRPQYRRPPRGGVD